MYKTAFVCDEIFTCHDTPAWHPESPIRVEYLIEFLKRTDLWDKLIHLTPQRATIEDIARVHTKEYINMILSIQKGELDTETIISPHTFTACLYAIGAIKESVDKIKEGLIERAFCPVRPPGHHAEANAGMGFCIFNNVAVGARYAQTKGFSKVLIVDFDAHHGNGTQHIFEEDESVFYFSTHQFPYYPDTGKETERGIGKGEGFTYNVTIRVGSGDKDFMYVYQDIFPSVVSRFSPDLILVSAGYDIHYMDQHSDLKATCEGVRGIVQGILGASDKPYIFVLEGGYDYISLSKSVKNTLEEMLYYPP
ncbi:MAG TPA: histone deacetylase [Nitrospirae bacterium]|nr:histone deacetylase [Nitrospirota bacterium]